MKLSYAVLAVPIRKLSDDDLRARAAALKLFRTEAWAAYSQAGDAYDEADRELCHRFRARFEAAAAPSPTLPDRGE